MHTAVVLLYCNRVARTSCSVYVRVLYEALLYFVLARVLLSCASCEKKAITSQTKGSSSVGEQLESYGGTYETPAMIASEWAVVAGL